MEDKMKDITGKSIHIIMNSGIEALTIEELANSLRIDKNELYKVFTTDEDILLMVFRSFEDDLEEFIYEIGNQSKTPAMEFDTFFKSLYNVFLQKPYYLSIIFDRRLKGKNSKVRKSIIRMRNTIENYLTRLIESGKKNNTFKTKTSTNLLVNKMLTEFRLLMQDEQYINEMIIDLELLKKSND
ncbi:MAG: hypothetical protein KQH79_07585 [Bacteroidetes bacterium]|nr:hypothetical protein [Bacteroidota bacterium]